MSDEPLSSFGYEVPEEAQSSVVSIQVAEAKHPETLQPTVAMWLRFVDDSRHLFILPIELAEFLADELVRWSARAREKHYED